MQALGLDIIIIVVSRVKGVSKGVLVSPGTFVVVVTVEEVVVVVVQVTSRL